MKVFQKAMLFSSYGALPALRPVTKLDHLQSMWSVLLRPGSLPSGPKIKKPLKSNQKNCLQKALENFEKDIA
jgi:hypothetical protein